MFKPIVFFDENDKKDISKFPMREPVKNKKEEPKKTKNDTIKESSNGEFKLDLTSMIDKGSSISIGSTDFQEPKRTKKKSSSSKNKDFEISMVDGDNKSDRPLNDFESNTPYMEKYKETNAILRSAIQQLDYGLSELQMDAEKIRTSNNRKKYDYLALIHGNMGSYLGNKISAARELNNTITKCNDLECKRYKELKMLDANKDDTKEIMDTYQAFVSMPVSSMGNYGNIGPSTLDMTLNSGMVNGIDIGMNGAVQANSGYDNYVRNMTPQQKRMALETNPDVQEVIVYNRDTGARYFEVMNVRTGEVIPNVDKTDMMLMDEFELDLTNNIARSVNMNISMPIITIGGGTINEY